jgi:hypothetical protein
LHTGDIGTWVNNKVLKDHRQEKEYSKPAVVNMLRPRLWKMSLKAARL